MNYDTLVNKERIYLINKKLHDGDASHVVLTKVVRETEVLEVLLLCSNRITLADGTFTNALSHNKTLRVLNLYNNKIGIEGAKRLADALKVNQNLEQLHLGYNHIGDKAAQILADSFAVNKSLRQIWLNGNRIGDKGAQKLANALARNYAPIQVTLFENNISSDMKKNIQSIYNIMANRDDEITTKNEELARKDEEIASKDEYIASLKSTLEQLEQAITKKGSRKHVSFGTPDSLGGVMGHGNNKRRRIGHKYDVNLSAISRPESSAQVQERTLIED
mmetsp:Transcript_1067/g.1866  ORF Transcript_1067/g.1866 Transcript_1067/m.1866 type:complete len:277 (+) Transcript_1067:65-895(+)|eukprot:CAMPEP_0183702092 /NCGR_PEP_ID=MMETSP0737-20130205/313_1 /TAXON_ID=385413 /ORGANISM="Thalassiosira miniscula, Strain CCMP1093" /LENGTH=276 /DNA_ID=CAMNT_0025928637 /DNA_START=60 /DNA_END=890 /DNA_ORIENTATION=+